MSTETKIRNICFSASDHGWNTCPENKHLYIDVESSEKNNDIVSIKYIYRDSNGEAMRNEIDEHILEIISSNLKCDNTEFWDTCDEEITLLSCLDNIISSMDSEEKYSLSIIKRQIEPSNCGSNLTQDVIDSFIIGVSMYLTILDIMCRSPSMSWDLIGISFDLKFQNLEASALTYNHFRYISFPLDACKITGTKISSDISLIYTSFFNGWSCNFIDGPDIEIGSMIYKIIGHISTSVMGEIARIKAQERQYQDVRISALEARISVLERYKIYSGESSD